MKYLLKIQNKIIVSNVDKQSVAKKLKPDFNSQLKNGSTGITGITK